VSRRLLPVALCCALLAGCGAASEPAALQAWEVEAPYLPPRDPSALPARSAPDPGSADADASDDGSGSGSAARDGAAPARTSDDAPAAGAPSDAEVEAELRAAYGGAAGTDVDRATIDHRGLASVPTTAPPRLRALIQAANQVARKPYVYGGGHGRNPEEIWEDSAYDCSGSISYALAGAGYIEGPMASGPMMTFGKPGPGKWVTIYANEGHAFMVVAGLRFDTSGRQRTGTRWQAAGARSYGGFTVRHPPGL
jgi:hypothetical protein